MNKKHRIYKLLLKGDDEEIVTSLPPNATAPRPTFISASHSGPATASAYGPSQCQPCRPLDDIAEEYKCCRKRCLANLGTPIQIAHVKARLCKDLASASAKVDFFTSLFQNSFLSIMSYLHFKLQGKEIASLKKHFLCY